MDQQHNFELDTGEEKVENAEGNFSRRNSISFQRASYKKSAGIMTATRRDMRNFYHRKAEEEKEVAVRGNRCQLFKITKQLGQSRKTYNNMIKDAHGNKSTTDQE